MDAIEKYKQQRMIVQNLQGIDFALKAAVTIKNASRAKISDLNANGTRTYSPEVVSKEIAKAKADILAQMTAVNTDMVKRLEELRTLLHDRDAVLDLSNPALSNALSLISTIGAGLKFEEAVKINANFIHDQSALNALKAAYQAHGVVSPGNIDALRYDTDSVIDNLKVLAFEGLVQDGSVNTFAGALSKLGALEGTTIEKVPDQQGELNSFRAAAGLPN